MINIESLDLRSLPRVSVADRKLLPTSSGLYFLLDGQQVLYVGKTSTAKGFKHRHAVHHRKHQFSSIESAEIAWLECSLKDEALSELENLAIAYFNPPLNRTPVPAKEVNIDLIRAKVALRKDRAKFLKKMSYTLSLNKKLRGDDLEGIDNWTEEVFGCDLVSLYTQTGFKTEELYSLATESKNEQPITVADNKENIAFAVPKPLLDAAVEYAKDIGVKPAEFFRMIWIEGLCDYSRKTSILFGNRKLKRLASEINSSKKD